MGATEEVVEAPDLTVVSMGTSVKEFVTDEMV